MNISKKSMAFKIFLDINIVIDLYYASRNGHKDAVKIYSLAEQNKLDAFISETIITTTAYVLRKHVRVDQLREIIAGLNNLFTVLSCDNRIISKALGNNIKDIEDAVLYETAKHHKIQYFISNDKKDFSKIDSTMLPVISSEKFLKMLEEK